LLLRESSGIRSSDISAFDGGSEKCHGIGNSGSTSGLNVEFRLIGSCCLEVICACSRGCEVTSEDSCESWIGDYTIILMFDVDFSSTNDFIRNESVSFLGGVIIGNYTVDAPHGG